MAHGETACVIVLIMAVAATVVSANATLVSATPADGAAVTAPSRLPDVLAFKLPALEAGRYRVEWTGLSVGGQPVAGGLSFEVVTSPVVPSR